ncbi:MAG: DinB family protein [Cyclobacteriaceae bacterium]
MAIDLSKIPEFYRGYFDPETTESVVELLVKSREDFTYLLNTFSNKKAEFRYAEGKWSVKDLIQHIIDGERIFTYRAVRFARNDRTDLSGFEQDDYVANAHADKRDIQDLMAEFTATRNSTILFFESLNEADYQRTGTANGYGFSVEVIGYMISGHLIHHLKVIREKYL